MCRYFVGLLVATIVLINVASSFGQILKDATVVHRIAPEHNNPRNSEGDFITLKDGRIMFIYSRYQGDAGANDDHAPAHLAARYSSDGGKTWDTKDELIVAREGKMNVMSVSLLRLQNGRIALWYLRKNSEVDCKPMLRFSDDEGKSWSEPIECTANRMGYFVLNNNRVIQLENGRLLLPVAHHYEENGKLSMKAEVYTFLSDDSGITWKAGEKVPNPRQYTTQEPGVVETFDGNILMLVRSYGGKQLISTSSDKGMTWSELVTSTIASPLSPASIARIPKSKALLLVWNNNGKVEQKWHGGIRTPLTVAISKDNGKSWVNVQQIETDPDGWYCYTAIHFTKRHVLLGYVAGKQSDNTHLSSTNITRIPLKNLL